MDSTHESNIDDGSDDSGSKARLFRFARRLMDRKDIAEDTKDILVSLAATSEKAKNDAVKLVAREVRNYLQELKADEILKEVFTGYTLEVSMRLQPIPPEQQEHAASESAEPNDDILGEDPLASSEE